MNSHTKHKPKWVLADREADLGDVWRDAGLDADCEYIVTGFYSGGDEMTLEGVSVHDGFETFYYGREAVLQLLGDDEVWRIEAFEGEAAPGPLPRTAEEYVWG